MREVKGGRTHKRSSLDFDVAASIRADSKSCVLIRLNQSLHYLHMIIHSVAL